MDQQEHGRIAALYDAFNRRDLDAVLAALHPDVAWANGMEGGHEHGRDAVRAYWTRQFQLISSQVTPLSLTGTDDGRVLVRVHQVVRSPDGAQLLADQEVGHLFRFVDGLVERFDIVD